jgi:hypothetical protein
MRKLVPAVTAAVLALGPATGALAAPGTEAQSLNELRNTVINLLQALVQRGVITKEQAEQMVKAAEDKAAADAQASALQKKSQEQAEAGAVKVPYVPQIVKDEISQEVAQQVVPQLANQMAKQGLSTPEWVRRVRLSGDIRVRGEGDVFASDNVVNTYPYLNWVAINQAGGFAKAGPNAFLNTSIDRYYLLTRLRVGFDADLGAGFSVGSRITTGNLVNPDSTNQVMGVYGGRYQTDIDLAYLQWDSGGQRVQQSDRQHLTLVGGKMPNPFFATELVWDQDVTFEGVAANYVLGLSQDPSTVRLVLTAGAFPVQEVALSSNDKWLYAGQIGLDMHKESGSLLRFGVAYYDFTHMAGVRNTPESTLTNYTAPPYFQKGNTVFDISNTVDPTVNLFALASQFRELDAIVAASWVFNPRYGLSWYFDYTKNLGYNEAAVSANYGAPVPPRIQGYQSELSVGSQQLSHAGTWRAFVGYRYLLRDAVVDAFTDQDYHLGGTDAKGYYIGADFGITDHVWARARYMSFDAIDNPPFGVDTWQLDMNARF